MLAELCPRLKGNPSRMIELTKQQARRFLLKKHGLSGSHRFEGKAGALTFIRQAGCIQFDPVNICGMNAELVLQSRVKGFSKSMLFALLYEDRSALDYYDKNLAIIPTEDWPYFSRTRSRYLNHARSLDKLKPYFEPIVQTLRERGPLSSSDLPIQEKVHWYWDNTNAARAALETLYFQGVLIVHHKVGTRKFYALAADHLPAELLERADPNATQADFFRWWVYRRIGSVGLLWNRASDAWLGINGLKTAERNTAFAELAESGEISEIAIHNEKERFYIQSSDLGLLESALADELPISRTELIAPLDNLLWDRKLIRYFFDFEYKWEVYTPAAQRKYGHYVLPILQGERFIGRCEPYWDKRAGTLQIKGLWLETDKADQPALQDCFMRFARFHEAELLPEA